MGNATVFDTLSTRQRDVLEQIANGACDKTIVRNLGIEFNTVRTHIRAILSHIGADNRTHAAVMYLRHKLTPTPS